MDGHPGGMYDPSLKSAHFSLVLLFVAASAGAFWFHTTIPEGDDLNLIPWVIGWIAALGALGVALVYLARAWTMMKALRIHRPGKKFAALMAIPLVNMAMAPRAVFGWGRLWNAQQRIHPGLQPAKSVDLLFFILFCILLAVVEILAVILGVAQVTEIYLPDWSWPAFLASSGMLGLVTLIVGWQICRSVNFLTKKKNEATIALLESEVL